MVTFEFDDSLPFVNEVGKRWNYFRICNSLKSN